jgi:hypothetical protein
LMGHHLQEGSARVMLLVGMKRLPIIGCEST